MLCKLCNKDIPIVSFAKHSGKCTGGRKRFTFTQTNDRNHYLDDDASTHHGSGDYRQSLLLNKKPKIEHHDTTSVDDDDNYDCNDCNIDFGRRDCDIYFDGVEEARQEGFNEYNEPLSTASNEHDDASLSQVDDHVNNKLTTESELPFKTDVGLPNSWEFQIELNDLMGRNRTNLKLVDDVNNLIKKHSNGNQLKFSSEQLQSRSSFLSNLEKAFRCERLKPMDVDVDLSHDMQATVSVFDTEAMILSLLHDSQLMKEENLAPGYDIYTGKVTEESDVYGEVHTGDAFERARLKYCGEHHPTNSNMPVALIIFGDKSHFDQNGVLCTTPMFFTLSCFNQSARNRPEFWRPMAYIPNLDHAQIKSVLSSQQSCQAEHNCLMAALQSIITIHKKGGISTVVKDRSVICKVWIHYIIGDCSGNNKWLGHFNGSGKLKRPYRDCHCEFCNLSDSNPTCVYITADEIQAAIDKETDTDLKQLSKHRIINAFMQEGVPLSDLVHGIYMMTPPELLHTTDEGITPYMFESMNVLLGEWKGDGVGDTGTEMKKMFNTVHLNFFYTKYRQSERNLPRGAGRTGFLKNTKVGASEYRGNTFILLCICHTTQCRVPLEKLFKKRGVKYDDFLECLKLYLAMQEWFHTNNPKDEVRAARPNIEDVIDRIKDVFPRTSGQGWKIPKVHGLTKMQTYMLLFGSGINFFGGPGECNHKKFVKDMANNTQKQILKFTSQVALRWYESNMFELAMEASHRKFNEKYRLVGDKSSNDDEYYVCGKYSIQYTYQSVHNTYSYSIKHSKKKSKAYGGKIQMSGNVIKAIQLFLDLHGWNGGSHDMTGYTTFKTMLDGRNETFRATDCFHGKSWYDWCMVEYNIAGSVSLYPSKIHAFLAFEDKVLVNSPDDYDKDNVFAVVQSSVNPLSLNQLEEDFISSFELGFDAEVNYQVVPIESIAHPLYVFENYEGLKKEFFCALPRRKWARYFGDKIET